MLWKTEPDPKLKDRVIVTHASSEIEAIPEFVGGYYRQRDKNFVLSKSQLRNAERMIDAGWRAEWNRYYDEPVAWHEDSGIDGPMFDACERQDVFAMLPPPPYRCPKTADLPF